MARHFEGCVPDNPRYATTTPDEQREMFCDDWLAGTACETCRHRETLRRELEHPKWGLRNVDEEWCLEHHDNGFSSAGECFRLDAHNVMETCSSWEMEE